MMRPDDLLRPAPAERRTLRLATLCAIAAGLSAVSLLALSGWFLTGAALAGAAGSAAVLAFNYLIPSAAIRGLAILRTVSRYGERLLGHRAALFAMADLRGMLFSRLAAQDSRTAPDLSGGDASARLIDDIEALEDLIVRGPARAAGIATALFAVALTALAGWRAAVVLAAMLAALPFLLALAARRLTATPSAAALAALGALRTAFVDYAAARAEIIAYGLEAQVATTLAGLARPLDRARAALARGDGAVAGLLLGYGALSATLVLLLARGPAPLRALALLAAAAAIEAMGGVARTALRRATVAAGLDRLAGLAALQGEAAAETGPYRAAAALCIGTDSFAPGARVLVSGVSGAGKTRLLEALAGLHAPVHPLSVAGKPVERCSQDLLRSQFALAPQDSMLIAGTIADNLRVARPGVTEDAMWAALHLACLDDRVAAMPAGLDTPLAESGGTLSGGERKRLSIARALLAGRPWLLLDEPTEGLDPATEQRLIARLDRWLDDTGTGLVLVSHRPAPCALARRQVAVADLTR